MEVGSGVGKGTTEREDLLRSGMMGDINGEKQRGKLGQVGDT